MLFVDNRCQTQSVSMDGRLFEGRFIGCPGCCRRCPVTTRYKQHNDDG